MASGKWTRGLLIMNFLILDRTKKAHNQSLTPLLSNVWGRGVARCSIGEAYSNRRCCRFFRRISLNQCLEASQSRRVQ